MSKQRWQCAILGDFRGLCENLPHMQSLNIRIEWGHNLQATIYLKILDTKVIFSLVSNLKKVLNMTSDPIFIETLLCSFVTFSQHLSLNV